jgi:hypothetical protein
MCITLNGQIPEKYHPVSALFFNPVTCLNQCTQNVDPDHSGDKLNKNGLRKMPEGGIGGFTEEKSGRSRKREFWSRNSHYKRIQIDIF